MGSIYNLSWNETSFIAKLQLFFKSTYDELGKIWSGNDRVRAEGNSALSSTYYSIVTTSGAQFMDAIRPTWLAPIKIVVWCFTWLPLSGFCYCYMLPLSNKVVNLIGYDGMTADMCDIRQSILRLRGHFEEAKRCIRAGLAKNPAKAHTRGLLRVGLADIFRREGKNDLARTETYAAILEAQKAEKEDPRQATRIYRHCIDLTKKIGCDRTYFISIMRLKAQQLAEETGAKDQLLKLNR